jgi:hypothetical protein
MRCRRQRGVMVDFSNLARTAVFLLSEYERMRFICRYLGRGRKPGEAKRLYRKVEQHLGRRPPKPLNLPAEDPES